MYSNIDVLIASTTGKGVKGIIVMQKKIVSGADHNYCTQLNVMNSICVPYIKSLALYKWRSSGEKPINSTEQAIE